MIKHVSFDVWNTLITANPQFASYRTKLIALALNLDADYVKAAYTKVKKFVDSCAEDSNGAAFTTPEVYRLLFKALGVSVSPGLEREIRLTVDELFLRFHPVAAPGAVELLKFLTERGISTSIGSNSNFISGNVMHPFLQRLLDHDFQYGVYSDLIIAAKPGRTFFNKVFVEAPLGVGAYEILHVGDNVVCDVHGPHARGIHGLLIESPNLLCEQVKLRIECENDFGVSFSHHLNTVE